MLLKGNIYGVVVLKKINLDEKIFTLQKSSYKTIVYQKKYTYYVVKVKVAAYNLRGLGRWAWAAE